MTKNNRKDINSQHIILDPIFSERKTTCVEISLLKSTGKKTLNAKAKQKGHYKRSNFKRTKSDSLRTTVDLQFVAHGF